MLGTGRRELGLGESRRGPVGAGDSGGGRRGRDRMCAVKISAEPDGGAKEVSEDGVHAQQSAIWAREAVRIRIAELARALGRKGATAGFQKESTLVRRPLYIFAFSIECAVLLTGRIGSAVLGLMGWSVVLHASKQVCTPLASNDAGNPASQHRSVYVLQIPSSPSTCTFVILRLVSR